MRTLLLEAGIANVLRAGPQPGTCSVNFPSCLLLSFKLLGIKNANERKQKPKSIGAIGLGMTEGDKIRNSTSFNWGGFHPALGGLRLVPRNTDHRDWNWSLLSSLLSACLPWPHSLSTRRWGFSIWQQTWSQQLDLFIFPTLTSEAKPRPVEQRHTEMPAEGSIWSCLTCSPWAAWLCPGLWATCTATDTSLGHPSSARHKFSEEGRGKLKQWLLCVELDTPRMLS